MSKSIWFINQYAGDSKSGWGERNFFIAEELVRKGHDVTIFTGTYNHLFINIKEFRGIKKLSFENGVRFCWIKTLRYPPNSKNIRRIISWFEFVAKLFLISKSNIPKPDFIIVSSMSMFPIANGVFFKRIYKSKKLIFEIRDLWPLSLISLGQVSTRHPLVILLSTVEKYAYKRADIIVSVLNKADQHIKTVIDQPFKFVWIPNGIKTGLLETADRIEIQPFLDQVPKDKFLVTYAGTMNSTNAMEYIIKAALALHNNASIHFLLIGDGDQLPVLKELGKGLTNLTFIPKVSKSNVQILLQYASVFIISWRNQELYQYGVSANKYGDYMLAGKPILVATAIENDPVALARCGVIVAPESVDAIITGIETLFNLSPDELNRMGQNGQAYAQENLLYSSLGEKYEKLLS